MKANSLGSELAWKVRNHRNRKQVFVTIFVGLLGLLIIQWLTPKIWGADGYLHVRMAEMIKSQGLLKSLPQARFSYFLDKFSDKDWLYHLFLIPFTLGKNIFIGAKWAAWLFGGVFYSSLVIIASYYVNPVGLALVGLAPFLSSHFLLTLMRPRPMVLGITLGLWVVDGFLRKKNKQVFLSSLLYSMTHITGVLAVAYGGVVSGWRWLFKVRVKWKLLGLAIMGVILGFLIHPNFPNNFFYFYLNGVLVPFFAAKWGVLELGAEFFPMTTLEYLKNYPLIIVGILVMTLIVLVERPRIQRKTQIMVILASVFVVMGMMSQRYIAHGYPFMVLGLGMFLSDWMNDGGFKKFLKKIERGTNLLMLVGVAVGLILIGSSFKKVVATARGTTIMNGHYEEMGNWLKDNVPEGELIFHANWSDSQYFIGINPKNDYFVTLDPVYMWHKNQEVYKLYRAVAFAQLEDPYTTLKEVFKVNYGYADKRYFGGLVAQVEGDERFEIVKEDQMGMIFKLK
jgi:hypothetical protein